MLKQMMSCLLVAGITFVSSAGNIKNVSQNGTIELDNGKIVVKAVSGDNGGLELFYWLGGKKMSAAIITPDGQDKPFKTECSADKDSILHIKYTGLKSGNAQISVQLSNDSEYVKISNFTNSPELRVNIDSQALVIPDQLAEDIVLYPGQFENKTFHLPSDNLLALNMLNDGNAMLSCVWQSERFKIDEIQDVAKKRFDALVIKPAEGQAFWLGVNSAVDVWHQVKEKLNTTKPVKIAWTPPFTARWVATMRKEKGLNEWESGLCDSWPIIDKVPGAKAPVIKQGIGITNTATWAAWSSFIGGYTYPCNFEKNGCFIQYPFFPNHQNIVYDSRTPVLIYPLQKVKGSPVNMLLPLDALELFAGKEAAGKLKTFRNHDDRYPATCGVTEEIEKNFYRGEQAKLKDRINERLKLMDLFVINIRKRIEIYLEWERKLLTELNRKQKNNPELTRFIEPYAKQLNAMQWRYAEAVEKMRQPEYCATLSAKMAKLTDADGDDEQKEEESKQLGRMIRVIGGSQDTTLGAMRYFVKCLRQQSALNGMTCEQPQEQEICKLMRRETAEILRPKCGMEGK